MLNIVKAEVEYEVYHLVAERVLISLHLQTAAQLKWSMAMSVATRLTSMSG